MGDAFRGLTIKIGADSRPVIQAINAIKSSANQAQAQLSRMDKALRFSSAASSMKALAERVDLAEDKTRLMARSVATVKTALEQAKSESLEFANSVGKVTVKIGDLKSDLKHSYSMTQRWRSEMVSVESELQHINDAMAKVYQKEEKVSYKKALRAVRELRKEYDATGDEVNEATEKIRRLLSIVSGSESSAKFKGFKGFEDLKVGAEKLIAMYERLRSEHSRLQTNLSSANKMEAFNNLRREALLAESQLRETSAQLTKMKAEAAAVSAPGIAKLKADLKSSESIIEASIADLRVFEDAYRAMPNSVEAFRNKLKATAAAQSALTEKSKQLKTAIAAIESQKGIKNLAASVKNANAAFESVSNNATEARVQFEAAKATVREYATQLRAAKIAFGDNSAEATELREKIKGAVQGLSEMRSKAKAADQALEQMAQVRELHSLRSELAAVGTELANLRAKASKLNTLRNIGNGLREFGFGLYASVTPALMMAGRYAIQAANDFDSAYRDMRKTVNATEEEYEGLRKAALEYSTTHFASADKILEIEAMGGQLGIAAENLDEFATTISNLDIATNIDADEAAEQMGKMATVLGISADQYDNFGDALVRLGNNMPVMESDIMTLMTRFMGMGKVVGMSADEMLGWSAAASATGQKAEAAGSSMQRFISNVETAVTSGGDKLETFASVAGMSADEFAEAFKTDASDAMYKFVEGLGEIQKEGGSVNQVLKELGINNVRDKQLLEGLAVQMANAGEGASVLAQALKMSRDAYNGLPTVMPDGSIEKAGDAAREAERKMEGFSGALQIMINNAQVLATELADGATPILKNLSNMFQDVTKTVSALPKEMKTTIVTFLGLAAAIGPLGVFFGTTMRAAVGVAEAVKGIGNAGTKLIGWAQQSLVPAIGPTTAGLTNAAKAATGFGKALQFIGSAKGMLAIAGVSIAVSAIVDGFKKAAENAASFKEATEGVAKASQDSRLLLDTAPSMYDDLTKNLQSAAMSYDELIASQKELAKGISERNEAASTEIANLSRAENALTQYLNKTNLTVTEQQRLKAAIELLNEKYGQNLSIIDLENGKIADNTGAILSNADALRQLIEEKKKAAKIDVLSANLAEQEVAADNAAASYAKASKEYGDFLKETAEMDPNSYVQWGEYFGTVAEVGQQLKKVADDEKEILDVNQNAANATSAQLDSLVESSDKATASISNLVKGQGAVNQFFGNDTIGLEEFANAVEDCGITLDDFYSISSSDWANILTRWSAGGESMSAILADIGVSTRSLGEQLTTEFQKVGGDMDLLNERAQSVSGGMQAFAEDLNKAGISAQDFSQMGIAGFDALYAAAGNDMTNLGLLIGTLNSQNIDPKTIQIDGSQITDAQGRVFELVATTDALGNTVYRLDLQVDASAAQETVEQVQQTAEEIGETDATAEVHEEGAEEAEQNINNLQEAGDNYDGDTFSATADLNTSPAYSALSSLRSELQAFATETYTATVSASQNASGGIIPENARGGIARIPRHASGGLNGIIARPTLTNIGWVGEAGAEAILHMRHAGGAVIPLSNRKYVRPFARAVAMEMHGGGTVNNINVTLAYDASADANDLARDLTRELNLRNLMGA